MAGIHLLFVRTKAASNGCKRTLWKEKNEYRYLTYMPIIGNSFDRQESRINKFDDKACTLSALRVLSLRVYDFLWLP